MAERVCWREQSQNMCVVLQAYIAYITYPLDTHQLEDDLNLYIGHPHEPMVATRAYIYIHII